MDGESAGRSDVAGVLQRGEQSVASFTGRTSYRRLIRMLQVAKSKDLEYWEALVEGETLRNAVDWLTKIGNDEGCALLEELMDTIFVHD